MSSSREPTSTNSSHPLLTPKLVTACISFGAGAAGGVAEVSAFHWLDTIIKRTQNKKGFVRVDGEPLHTSYSKVFFGKAHGQSYQAKFLSLHAGFNYALIYKIGQRTYKFGCQPVVNDFLKTYCGDQFRYLFGNKAGLMTHVVAGSILGMFEATLFLPLDMRKIKSQTNKEMYAGMSIREIARQENVYKGLGVTITRNIIGSGAMFGVMHAMKTSVLGVGEKDKMTLSQNAAASFCASTASIASTNWLDVIKTRVQANKDDTSATRVAFTIFKQEGPQAFMKSLGLKVATQVPKLAFSMFVYNWIVDAVTAELAQKLPDRSLRV